MEMVKRLLVGTLAASAAVLVAALGFPVHGAAAGPACDPDNGGLKLPQGFCAFVAADNLGRGRHLTVAPNGDVYVALQSVARGAPAGSGPIVALRDTDGDGRLETKETFGAHGGTGIAIENGYLYVAAPTSVDRYKMTPGQLEPTGEAENIAVLPPQGEHADKGIAFDGKGSFYVNVGAPSNACQTQDRIKGIPGQDPCPILEEHGGVWKFDENKLGQKQSDGMKYATGLRQFPAITWHDGALYAVMNNRDSIDQLWPEHFTAEDNDTRPAEPMYKITQGGNYGWPFCFWDYTQSKYFLNPEYGGDGKTVGRCSGFTAPIAAFPAHWAPVDVMFYSGTQFPRQYRGGAFIAFHGSWNRTATGQQGYNVTFQPFSGDKPSGAFEVFADGFAGKDYVRAQNDAQWRADGVAQAPDGSLYIVDSQKGRLWRVMYTGK
jgi:glucose/arabinose dehydrogenase